MLDKMLEVGAGFDWISPMVAVVGDLVNGGGHTFLIPYASCPMSGVEVERLLRRRGVRTWGAMVVSGTLMVSVKLSQARFAQHLLEGAGVPVENPLPTGQAAAARGRTRRSDVVSRSKILRSLKGGRS